MRGAGKTGEMCGGERRDRCVCVGGGRSVCRGREWSRTL